MTRGAKTMAPKGKKDQGVALFQTLLITAMLALIAIGFSQRTQDHVHQAQRLEDRTRAMLLAHSAVQDALFVLLTESEPPPEAKPCGESDGDNVAPERGFNRYGAPFCLEGGAKVIIQDLSGLLPVAYPDHPLWPRFLREVGLDENQIQEMLGTLSDFQDRDRRTLIRGTPEPETLPSGRPFTNRLVQRPSLWDEIAPEQGRSEPVQQYIHLKGPIEANPFFTPSQLLQPLFGEAVASEIARQRRQGTLLQNNALFQEILAPNPDAFLIAWQSSSRVRLRSSVETSSGSVSRTLIVDLDPGAQTPFEALSFTKF